MCGKHAERDPGTPKFECVICAPHLLTASAVMKCAARGAIPPVVGALSQLTSIGIRSGTESVGPPYDSVADFIARHPNYGRNLLDELRRAEWNASARVAFDNPVTELVSAMNEDELALLGAAKLIVERLHLPESSLSPALQVALSALMRRDQQYGHR